MLKNITDKTHYLIMPIPPNTRDSYRFPRPGTCFNLIKTDFKGGSDPFLRSLSTKIWGRESRRYNYKNRLAFAIPLEYNHRKRETDRLKRGAVIVKNEVIYIRDENNINLFRKYDHAEGRVPETTLHYLDPDFIKYQGTLPKELIDPILNGERIMIDDMLFETEVIRGPRVEVTVHHRQPIDLNPETTTFQMLRELDLVSIESINHQFGVTLLEMTPNDTFAQLVARQLLLDPERVRIDALQNLSNKAYKLFFYQWEDDDKRVLFPTYGEEPGMISYFNGYRDFIRGRETLAKIGKVAKRLSENSSDDTIKSIVDRVLIAQLPDDYYMLESSSDIVSAYRNGPSSCTSYPNSHYSRLREISSETMHPTAVYGGESDVKMYVLKKGDRIMARALVVPEKMEHIVVYPKSASSGTPERDARDALLAHLKALGYEHNPGCIVGCVLNKIQLPNSNLLVYPYIDENCYRSLVLDDCLVTFDQNCDISTLNSKLTEKARAKIAELFANTDSLELKYIHAGHQEGAGTPCSMGTHIGYLNGEIGNGLIIDVLEANGTYERRFRAAVRNRDYAQIRNTECHEEFVSLELLNRYAPVSYFVSNYLSLQTHNQRLHPDFYATIEAEYGLVNHDGELCFPAEIVTTIDGIAAHLDKVTTFRTRDGVIFVRCNDRIDNTDYISQAIREGLRNESEAA